MAYEMICPQCRDEDGGGPYQGPATMEPEGNDATAEWYLSHVAEYAGHSPIIKDVNEE